MQVGGFICLDEAQTVKLISMLLCQLACYPSPTISIKTGPYSLGTYRLMSF